VAAGHPATSRAAAAMLAAGGNAFDAVVAAGFAAGVAEPQLTGLGGGGFLLTRTAGGVECLYDFFVDTPGRGSQSADRAPDFVPVTVHFGQAEQDFNVGLGSVAVPGCLAGYLRVHAALGRLPLAEVVAPAAALARDGVALNSHHAYLVEILQPILTASAAGRRLYTCGGRPLAEGERLVNSELARFLAGLAAEPSSAGPRGFAAPALAERIARDMADGGGLLSAEDLAAYRVCERAPLTAHYRGHRVLTNPPPAFGGSLLALSLSLLAEAGAPPPLGSAAQLERLVEVMIETDAIRARGGSEEPLREGHPLSTRGTTHVSVCDREGNVAAMTTSNGESSGYIAPGTGVMLNNMLGEDDLHPDGFHAAPPGRRVASMMCPSLLLRDGEVVLALGSGGSKRIRTALLQVIGNVVDYGLSAREAVEAPRLHWDGERVELEPGFADAAVQALAERWPVNRWDERNLYFGGVQAVAPGQGGAGDPRRGGSVVDC
jgi:gamma-glutamyltranspeptidase/glutathione hydrolase